MDAKLYGFPVFMHQSIFIYTQTTFIRTQTFFLLCRPTLTLVTIQYTLCIIAVYIGQAVIFFYIY